MNLKKYISENPNYTAFQLVRFNHVAFAFAALLTFSNGSTSAQQAAFPTADGATPNHYLPFDGEDTAPESDDPDDPKFRERNAFDDLKIEQEKARKARKASAPAEQIIDPLLTEIPDAPVVREIEIAGVQGTDLRRAKNALVSREGEPLNPDKQREDIKKLYDIGSFKPDIQVEADEVAGGVKLRYLLESNPKVGAINVTGNLKVTTKKILGELPVKAGETYTIQAQNKIRDTIARFYEERGFADAVIRVEERPSIENTVDLNITVDEGTKTKIRDLVIQGNQSVSDLKLKIRANNKGSWGPFKHHYNEAKFEDDLNAVRGVYANHGFLDADVRRGDFVYAEDHSWVDPVIQVTEGPQYKFGRLEARGFSVYSRDEVLEPFRALQGQTFSQAEFQKRAERIKNMYGDEGFLNCQVEPELHKDPNTGTVDVDLDIAEGSRIYVGDVKVVSQAYPEDTEQGWLRRYYSRFSPPVKDEVVQREVRMRPGQVYRRFDEVRTKERLKSLNVFQDVRIQEQMTEDPNVHDAVVEVEQGNTGNLIFGAGFGDVEGGFLYANYIEHNLFGMARDLKVSALLGSKALSGEITYLDRYFMGSDIAAQFSLFHRRLDRTGAFEQTNTGIMADFTRPISECMKDSVRLRLEAIGYELEDGREPEEELNDYVAATIRYRICHDTRDDTFFPTYGHVAAGQFETGAADGFLAKLEGQYAQYWQVSDNWVVANNTVAGIMPYDATNIGYADRFFLGGGADLRGFRVAGAGDHDSRNESIPLGGSTKLLNQTEARRLFTDNIAGVVFADVGMLGRRPFEIGTPRASVGTGVRMRLPMASVSLDLAVPVVSQSKDQTQFFHFNLTSSF